MKKKRMLIVGMILVFVFGFSFINSKTNTYEVKSIMYQTGSEDIQLKAGAYTSSDGHTITIASDRTVLYDGTYTLTISENTKGSTLTGKIGTNKKSVTFYQLNNSKIVSGAVMDYTHGGTTVYLYDYTVFSLDTSSVVEADSGIELWSNGIKVNSYADLQSAVDAATSGDTIKLTKNLSVTGGAYVKGKKLTIDGNNTTLNNATWLNSVFIVEEDATLEINNLTIDGGSTGFLVDYDKPNVQTGKSTAIPLVSGSDIGDIKLNLSPVISKGNLVMNSSNINNNYVTGTGNGGAVNIVSGNLTLSKSSFNHNRASKGGALYIGSNFKVDQTDFSIKKILIENCEFNSNYSSNGGAIFTYNVDKFDILNTKFIKNTVTGGKGGAILINNQTSGDYWSMVDKHNLEIPQYNIDNCLFEENWVGNDGSALENHEASVKMTNTVFRKNVGIHSSSSCGTVSAYISMPYEFVTRIEMIFENCLFEENVASASTIADHGSTINIKVDNTKFIRNKATYNSMLIYSSNVTIKDSIFEEEYVTRGVLDIQSYNTEEFDSKPATIILENVTIKNTKNGSTDIVIRKKNADDLNYPWTVILNGNNTANIDLWDNNTLIINGEHNGTINVDNKTLEDNLIIGKNAVINDKINWNKDKILVTLIYSDTENVEGYNWEARKYIYVDEKEFDKKEFFLEHQLSKEGYELKLYTNNTYTTEWDYVVSSTNVDTISSLNLYGRWEEHTHAFTEDLILYENAIYEQCECGYLGKKIELKAPKDLIEDGKEKEIIVENEIGISASDYKITYKKLTKNGKWEEYEGIPKDEGTYKAILIYKNMNIEKEYSIEKNKEENTTIKNPDTGDNIEKSFIMLIISGILIITTFINYKKKLQNN